MLVNASLRCQAVLLQALARRLWQKHQKNRSTVEVKGHTRCAGPCVVPIVVWGGFIHGSLEVVVQMNFSLEMRTYLHKILLLEMSLLGDDNHEQI